MMKRDLAYVIRKCVYRFVSTPSLLDREESKRVLEKRTQIDAELESNGEVRIPDGLILNELASVRDACEALERARKYSEIFADSEPPSWLKPAECEFGAEHETRLLALQSKLQRLGRIASAISDHRSEWSSLFGAPPVVYAVVDSNIRAYADDGTRRCIGFWHEEEPEFAPTAEVPGRVGKNHWVFRGELWRSDPHYPLLPEQALALITADENRKRLKVERAMALMAMAKNLDNTRRRDAIPREVKIAVWLRDSGRCVKCGTQENLEFDHIIPISLGGANTERNIQILCSMHNREKGPSLD